MFTLPSSFSHRTRYIAAVALSLVALHPARAVAQSESSKRFVPAHPDSSFVFEGLPWGADSATITRGMIARGWARTDVPRDTKETGNDYLVIWEHRPARASLFYDHGRFTMASVEVPLDSTQAVQYMTDVVAHMVKRHGMPDRWDAPERGSAIGTATWKGNDANVVAVLQTRPPQFGPVTTSLRIIFMAKGLRPE